MSDSPKMGHNCISESAYCSNDTTDVTSNRFPSSHLTRPLDANATSINCDERLPLLTPKRSKTTLIRFYVLLLFSLFGFFQNVYFNNFAPIADSMEVAMEWNDRGATVAWLSNIAAVSYLPGTLMFYIITGYLGLRCGVVVGVFLVCVCGILRCFIFTFSKSVGTVLLFVAQFLNGLAGPVVVSATTQLSANWFPSNERNIATALSGQSSNLGISISFILGPLLVPDVNTSCISSYSKSDLTDSILRLLYMEAAAPVALFALIVLYFPSRPKSAPSASAAVERLNFSATVKSYIRNYPLILLSLCYAIPVGVNTGWVSFLYPNLRELSLHITQNFVGWLGFYMMMGGVFGSLVFSKIADCFPRRKKLLIVSLSTIASILLVVFSLICMNVFRIGSYIYPLLTTTIVLCGVFMMAIDPIIKEIIVEVGFPIAEFNSILVASFAYNFITILFLAVAGLSSLGTGWINWLQSGVYIGTTFVMLLIPISHPRLDKDTS